MIIKLLNFVFYCILFLIKVNRNYSLECLFPGLKFGEIEGRYGCAKILFLNILHKRDLYHREIYVYVGQQDPHYLLSYMYVDGYKGGLRGPTCFVGSRNRIVVNTHCETRVTLNNKSISRDKDGP